MWGIGCRHVAIGHRSPGIRWHAAEALSDRAGSGQHDVAAGYRDDRGGNRYQVQFEGSGSNLHRVWDSALLHSRGLDRLRERAGCPQRGVFARVAPGVRHPVCAMARSPVGLPARPGSIRPTTKSAGLCQGQVAARQAASARGRSAAGRGAEYGLGP
ncbi:MAG: hypothetical protein EPN74_08730 [Rhodanobacter sp.]|nr:MAG: hypothetical protein EPN74_08730 [Rhodanobacter sp.]